MSASRKIEGQVIGTAPLESVTILKNDQVLWNQSYGATSAPKNAPMQVAVAFSSSSEPVNPRDNPRGWRPWTGTVKAQGARIIEGRPVAAPNTSLWEVAPAPGATDAWSFSSASRGSTSTLVFTLDEVKSGATLDIRIEPGQEFGGAPPAFRPHQPVEPVNLSIRLADLRDGAQSARVRAVDYQDEMWMFVS